MPVISAVVVSYRSAALASRAIESLRSDAAGAGLTLETIAVVNSGDPQEARALSSAADGVVFPGRNLGFAGGLNAGVEAARGEILVLANPDVVVREGALAALAAEARGPLAAAGPALFLDEGETLHLPPAEEPHPFDLARRGLAGSGAPAAFRRRFRRARRAAEGAERKETCPATALSGAFVAVSRQTLERVGRFDERYVLYFEENDWQRRLRKAGGRLSRVGAARVVHRYNQSALLEPRAAGWFASSERRYFETHFGARGVRALEALATPASTAAGAPAPASLSNDVLFFDAPAAAIALSPVPDFGAFALDLRASGGSWRPPEDVRRGFGGAAWFVRAVDPKTLDVLAEGRLEGTS
ncbi:MAG TPA: glycosyltransferase family 2 protein [Thermoanaerobaculia bacterium]|nr:glycosyltransferase family 2 protein [Thermoanaerobaculia bacterium]